MSGDAANVEPAACWLCERPLGEVTEWHHPIPKSKKGKLKFPVHPICHQTIHATFTNGQLAKAFATAEALRGHEDIGRFIDWVAGKPPDFYAPTKKAGR